MISHPKDQRADFSRRIPIFKEERTCLGRSEPRLYFVKIILEAFPQNVIVAEL